MKIYLLPYEKIIIKEKIYYVRYIFGSDKYAYSTLLWENVPGSWRNTISTHSYKTKEEAMEATDYEFISLTVIGREYAFLSENEAKRFKEKLITLL